MEDKPEFVWVIERDRLFAKEFTPYGFIDAQNKNDQFGSPIESILEDAFFMERNYAEKHSQYKQIIPYTIVFLEDDKVTVLDEMVRQLFVYKRLKKGNEQRLHNKLSIGIGGHINPEDMIYGDGTPLLTLINGAVRELHEELCIESAINERTLHDQLCEPIGFINDDTTEVGAVHFGVVNTVIVQSAVERETDQIEGRFVFSHILNLMENKHIEFETWSRFMIDQGSKYLSG